MRLLGWAAPHHAGSLPRGLLNTPSQIAVPAPRTKRRLKGTLQRKKGGTRMDAAPLCRCW